MQRIYGFVQEEDGVVSRLLTEISAYFEYLARQHGDYVAFHNVKIPMEGYMAQLAPYNINRNPYCLYVKSKPEVWNTCIARQGKVVDCCASGPFCGTCYAGMGEFVFPVLRADGAVLCFLSVSGYCMDEQTSMQKMRHFARKYDLQLEKLKEVYQESVRTDAPQIEELRVRIAPLCNMFALLHRELSQLPPKALESQRQSSLLSHAIVYLQKNYAQPLRAEDVAAYCHCSVSTLSHLFKKETEKSIPEYKMQSSCCAVLGCLSVRSQTRWASATPIIFVRYSKRTRGLRRRITGETAMKKRIRNLPFFDPDSKPMQVLGTFADMIVLNVCFLIGCLPVVTVGASMSALYAAMLRRQRGEGSGVFAAFWKDWKQNLRPGIACWLMQLAVTAFFAFDFWFSIRYSKSAPGLLGAVEWVSVLGLLAVTLLGSMVYPQIARFENRVRQYWKNAALLLAAYPLRAIGNLLLFLPPVILFVFWRGLFLRIGFIFPLFAFSLMTYLSAKVLRRPLREMEQGEPV